MIKPVLHRILVKADPVETKTASGIIVATETEAKRYQAAADKGTVMALGSTVFKDYGENPDLVVVGDRVYYAKYAGKEVIEDGEKYILVNDEDILAIIKE